MEMYSTPIIKPKRLPTIQEQPEIYKAPRSFKGAPISTKTRPPPPPRPRPKRINEVIQYDRTLTTHTCVFKIMVIPKPLFGPK
jgi:hypothetical protein